MVITVLLTLQELTDDYEVIVVNDGSADYTAEVPDELAWRYERVRVIHHPQNRGYGGALRTEYIRCDGRCRIGRFRDDRQHRSSSDDTSRRHGERDHRCNRNRSRRPACRDSGYREACGTARTGKAPGLARCCEARDLRHRSFRCRIDRFRGRLDADTGHVPQFVRLDNRSQVARGLQYIRLLGDAMQRPARDCSG